MNMTSYSEVNKREISLLGLHILMGLLAAVFPYIVPYYIVAVILIYILKYSTRDKNKIHALVFISYLTGLEILNRAIGVSFLPYEFGKYVQIVFIVMNVIIAKTWFKSPVGIIIIIFLLPSLILLPPDFYKNFIFNSMGILALGLFISFTAYQKIRYTDFIKILKSFLYTCIIFVTYITIKTPKFSEIEFSLHANFDTAGGFGSNQVATILGAAICFLIIMIDQRHYIGNRLISLAMILYFTLRALLTFSRGGLIGVAISVVLSYLLFKKLKQRNVIKLAIIGVVTMGVFILTNDLTQGQLLLRYQGETAGTLSGTREKDINVLLSGRNTYAQVDLALWMDNFVLGVGPGNSKFLRYQYGVYDEAAPHTEATRLLAENGIFGLFINLILILWPLYIISRTPDRNMKFIKSILFLFAYATTYHSAMRTGITPLFYGLASMNFYFPNEYSKQIS